MIVEDRNDVVTVDQRRWIALQVVLFGLLLALGLAMACVGAWALFGPATRGVGSFGCLGMGLFCTGIGAYGAFSRTWLEVDGSTRTVRRVSMLFRRRWQRELSPGRIVRVAVRAEGDPRQYEIRFETNESILGFPRWWPACSCGDAERSNADARRMAELLGVTWVPYGAEPIAEPKKR